MHCKSNRVAELDDNIIRIGALGGRFPKSRSIRVVMRRQRVCAVGRQLFVAFSGLGTAFKGYFFAFHLLHVVYNNQLLQRVILAVTQNGETGAATRRRQSLADTSATTRTGKGNPRMRPLRPSAVHKTPPSVLIESILLYP